MEYINYASYTLSLIFLILVGRVLIKEYRYRRAIKPQKKYREQTKKLRDQGLKPFKFNKGKTEIWAHNFKDAQREYNNNRSNRKSKSSTP